MAALNRTNVFDQIQSICRDFRKRLKNRQSASIEKYLLRVDDSARETLFQNLLHSDIEFRRRRGDDPSSEDYILRFPQFERLIRQAFFESTIMSQEFSGDTPDADIATVTLGIPAARRIGDYELLRELGRGGFGVVYEARHLQRGDHVALKTLPMIQDAKGESAQDAERLHRFRKEFRSLAEINHPNLAGMQTLEVEGAQWFITMDLVEGVDFLTYNCPAGQLDEFRIRNSLKQLTRGIVALHQKGIVHRDLKPSNVLIRSDGHLVILDFGLVAELQQLAGETLSIGNHHFAGTPRYAAPEQISGERTSAIDWYAAGVMLYEAIVGTPPFSGNDLQALISKQNNDAPQLSGRNDIPADLADLVDRMLQRDPKNRPESDFLAQTLGIKDNSTTSNSSFHINTPETPNVANKLRLFGRQKQLADLSRVLHSFLRVRKPVSVFIKGRSGEGKTAMTTHFLSNIEREEDVLILAGRCYDRESVPFKAIDCLTDPLVDYLRRRQRDELLRILPEDIGILAHLFPLLRRIDSVSNRSAPGNPSFDSQQVRYRAFAALKELLANLGRMTPIILFVDDLQWGDADSARALHEIVSSPDPPPVLVIGAYRSDEAEESPYLTEWKRRRIPAPNSIRQHEISVSPLDPDEAVTLLSTRLRVPPETVRSQIQEVFTQTHGNPYFLEQLIEGFDRETHQFEVVPLSTIIVEKLGRLETRAKQLLDAIAVAGQAVALDEAARVVDIHENAFKTVTHMRSERLLRIIGSVEQPTIDTYHDKIRESVLNGLKDSRRRSLHARFGELLENEEQINPAIVDQYFRTGKGRFPESARYVDLSFHFSRADAPRKASVYGYLAAKQAKEQFSLETAVEHFKDAYGHCNDGGRPLRYAIALGLGECLQSLGRFDEAEKVLREGHELAETLADRCEVELCLAETMRGDGRFKESAQQYVRSLRSLGVHAPERPTSLAIQLAKESVVHLKRWLLWKPKPRSEENARIDLICVRLLAGYMLAIWFRNLPSVAWSVLAGVNRAERLNPSAERALACATAAYELIEKHMVINFVTSPTMTLLLETTRSHALSIQDDSPQEARKLIQRGCRLGRKLALLCKTTPAEQPSVLREWAELLALSGKQRKARRLLRKSCSLAEKMGEAYELACSQFALAKRMQSVGAGQADSVAQWKRKLDEFEDQCRELIDAHPLLRSGPTDDSRQPTAHSAPS